MDVRNAHKEIVTPMKATPLATERQRRKKSTEKHVARWRNTRGVKDVRKIEAKIGRGEGKRNDNSSVARHARARTTSTNKQTMELAKCRALLEQDDPMQPYYGSV